jgi:hypothetical protein
MLRSHPSCGILLSRRQFGADDILSKPHPYFDVIKEVRGVFMSKWPARNRQLPCYWNGQQIIMPLTSDVISLPPPQAYPHFYCSRGRDGSPVYFERSGQIQLHKLRKAGATVDTLLWHCTWVF